MSSNALFPSHLVRQLAAGLLSHFRSPQVGTGGSSDGLYCYSVYMRHFVIASQHGLPFPANSIAEIGPGDSIGVGLCALLTGTRRYVGLDVMPHANQDSNLRVLDKIATLLETQAPIPSGGPWAEIRPDLPAYDFPNELLGEASSRSEQTLDRAQRLRAALSTGEQDAEMSICYLPDQVESASSMDGEFDWILSQAAMEHVDDLASAYARCFRYLRPGGYATHQIDLRSHDTACTWDGHWTYPDWLWKLIRGERPWLINRAPASEHLELMAASGLEVVHARRFHATPETSRRRFAERFQQMTDEDTRTASMFVISRRPACGGRAE